MDLPKLTIKQLEIQQGKRILVTSDIHGHLSYFKKVLKKAGYCSDDLLIIIGDKLGACGELKLTEA